MERRNQREGLPPRPLRPGESDAWDRVLEGQAELERQTAGQRTALELAAAFNFLLNARALDLSPEQRDAGKAAAGVYLTRWLDERGITMPSGDRARGAAGGG